MSHLHHFHTIDNNNLNIAVDQIRHIEFTSDNYGETVIILHHKDTDQEFVLDGEDATTTNEMNLLLKEAGIY